MNIMKNLKKGVQTFLLLVLVAASPILSGSVQASIAPYAGGGTNSGLLAREVTIDPFALSYANGEVFFTLKNGNLVQKITEKGEIITIAGTGLLDQVTTSYPGAALLTSFTPVGLDSDGQTTFIVSGRKVLKLENEILHIFSEPGGGFDLVGPVMVKISDTHVYVTDPAYGRIARYPRNCTNGQCQPDAVYTGFHYPYDIEVLSDGLLILEQSGRVYSLINGIKTLIAGGGSNSGNTNVPALQARFAAPIGFCRAPNGDVYIADKLQSRIVRIRDGLVTTVAGTGQVQNKNNWIEVKLSDPATLQPISQPDDCVVDDFGEKLFISTSTDKRIYALDITGPVPTVTFTVASTPTHSPRPTDTAIWTPTWTQTVTRTKTVTLTPISTWTNTPVPTSTFTATATPTFSPSATPLVNIICDVTGDKDVSSLDAAWILQKTAGFREFTPLQMQLADATGNGLVTTTDAVAILQVVAGFQPSNPLYVPNHCGVQLR